MRGCVEVCSEGKRWISTRAAKGPADLGRWGGDGLGQAHVMQWHWSRALEDGVLWWRRGGLAWEAPGALGVPGRGLDGLGLNKDARRDGRARWQRV